MRRHLALAVTSLLACAAVSFAADRDGFEDEFNVHRKSVVTTGRNDYFILEPGYQLVLEGKDHGKPARLVITVTNDTKKVDGFDTRIVEEFESVDGKTVEVSRNFFAIDKETRDVYYFGEEVDDYKDGKIVGHRGAWESGKKGARFGLMMPGAIKVGRKHYQEIAPRVAMDRAEIVSDSEKVSTTAGEFQNCLKTRETTPLEPEESEHKFYAKGVGLLVDGPHKLVKYGKNIEPRPAAAHEQQQQKPPQQPKKSGKVHTPDDADVIVPVPLAREALDYVGVDPNAEALWLAAINDPALSLDDRKDLIEDLNTNGFPSPRNLTADDLPLIVSRLELIEQLAPDAIDQVNADAFAEAYKDLNNMLNRVAGR